MTEAHHAARANRPPARVVLDWAEAAVANPILAYGAILVLQLRVIWNVWRYKDLTPGDTSFYFLDAAGWTHGLHDNVIYYPLYTDIWGTLHAVLGDVYASGMVNRVGIIFAATGLMLAVMRSLLGPAMGLLIVVWWVLLPPNFNLVYDVHLFGLLPMLIAVLVVARRPGREAMGIALATLAAGAVLARNELILGALIVAVAILFREFRARGEDRTTIWVYLRAYGLPLVIAFLLVGAAYWRSHIQGHDVQAFLRAKHTTNLCEAYAVNYQQRHPTRFLGNPFTGCAPLMQHDFGRPMPTFFQATSANPRAMAGFVAWNGRLMESGLQLGLFGATATGDNPTYFPVQNHRSYALVLSVILLGAMLAGLVLVIREREQWLREWPRRGPAIIVLSAVAATSLFVALTQRPQPDYMYGLIVGVMALAGVCTAALLRQLRGYSVLAAFAVGLTAVLILALPSYYGSGPRPLRDGVKRLRVVRSALQRPGSVLIAGDNPDGTSLCNYLAYDFTRACRSITWSALTTQVSARESLAQVLASSRASAIYAEGPVENDPTLLRLLAPSQRFGWRQIATGSGSGGPWRILVPVRGG
ncbi:MAG: hypothetical protein E6G56_09520 [Actinobacteria bacterium]|nr:MAG: hypothetical protein E6G56_09520 [Actinomycetota bacterium]